MKTRTLSPDAAQCYNPNTFFCSGNKKKSHRIEGLVSMKNVAQSWLHFTHRDTDRHTHIYILRERERERESSFDSYKIQWFWNLNDYF